LITKVYSQDDVRQIVQNVGLNQIMDDIIAGLQKACEAFNPARDFAPERDGFQYSKPYPGLIEWMPAMKGGEEVVIKIVGYHPENPREFGVPTILSTVLCLDPCTGHLLAIMDGNLLTAMRTASASAMASRILARKDSSVLGIVGCGAQAIAHLHAMTRVFDIQQVNIYDSDPINEGSFSARASYLNLKDIEICSPGLNQVVGNADVLCTATSVPVGKGPIFDELPVKSSVHVNAIGSDFHGKIELPVSLLERSLVCPDFRAQAMREGECQQLRDDQIGPDLLALVNGEGKYLAYRDSCTVFDSTGWALEDQVTMGILMQYGRELGCGTDMNLANISSDPYNPYAALVDPKKRVRQVG
jgi:ornithine cyclodeaminase/alanine dehydrogenase-like protein (mu-crystallin family)